MTKVLNIQFFVHIYSKKILKRFHINKNILFSIKYLIVHVSLNTKNY
jgi:hypothetical protein